MKRLFAICLFSFLVSYMVAQNMTDRAVMNDKLASKTDLDDWTIGPAIDDSVFLCPDRVKYDSRCLQIEGKDVFLLSGTMHYFRTPQPLWRDRLEKIKALGFNGVETYVPWNWHEREMPTSPDDFSKVDLQELDDFLALAEEVGLYTIVRPGPYICAEWSGGGFPQWLMQKRPAKPLHEVWLQSMDPEFLKWNDHWYQAVCRVVAPHQLSRKPKGAYGVVLMQVENEFNRIKWFPRSEKRQYLEHMAQQLRKGGIDVPLISCWTDEARNVKNGALNGVVDMVNSYPRWQIRKGFGRLINQQLKSQPGKPLISGELQGGWSSDLGTPLSWDMEGQTPAQTQNITLYALQRGFCALNYYMLVGGTNFEDWAARNQTASYDFAAAIGEDGSLNERYYRFKSLAEFINQHGTRIARSRLVPVDYQTTDSLVELTVRHHPDGTRYFFVRTEEYTRPHKGTLSFLLDGQRQTLDFDLEPFGSKVYVNGAWYPKEVEHTGKPQPHQLVKTHFAQASPITPQPSTFSPLKEGQTVDDLGHYRRYPLLYKVTSKVKQGGTLTIERVGKNQMNRTEADVVLAFADNKPLTIDAETDTTVSFIVPKGIKTLTFIYDSRGLHHHTNKAVEQHWHIGPAYVTFNGQPVRLAFTKADSSLFTFHSSLQAQSAAPLWLRLSHKGDGFVYLNGHCLGRYYEHGPQKEYYMPECWLHGDGTDEVCVCLLPTAGSNVTEMSADGRYLVAPEGKPFFVIACTAWTLPQDYTMDEVRQYLDHRQADGFNTIQMSAVFSEIDKQAYQKAFHKENILKPVESYWQHVDSVVKEASDRGLTVVINPIWKRSVNEFLQKQGVKKCRKYGEWFARRYKDNPRVLYFIGGDQVPEPVRQEMDAMGEGIQKVYGGRAIVAYHSCGSQSSREAFPNAEWLTWNWTYAYSPSYKFEGAPRYPYQMNYENYKEQKGIPIHFGEGFYDFGTAKKYSNNGTNGRWAGRRVLRRQAWWNATSGAMGVAYGAEGIWHKDRDGQTWQQCVEYESGRDMIRLRHLLDRLPWQLLQPDIEHQILTAGYGEYLTDDYATCAVASDQSLAVVYTPVRHTMTIAIPQGHEAWTQQMHWYDPSNGQQQPVSDYTLSGGTLTLTSPMKNWAGDEDWVLVLGMSLGEETRFSTQRPPLTPAWMLGHIAWEDNCNTQTATLELIRQYREHDIPVDGIFIDSPWSTSYNDFIWDKKRYPDAEAMAAQLKEWGVKPILWLTSDVNITCDGTPQNKCDDYDEMLSRGYAINNGQPSKWWKGTGLQTDFTNAEAKEWFFKRLDRAFTAGFYGLKVDQGEVYFGDSVTTSIGRMSNTAFRPYYYDVMYDYVTSRRPSLGGIVARPYSHQGGLHASTAKTSVGWCGDFAGDWRGLKLQIDNIYRSAQMGYGAVGTEIAGFMGAKADKLSFIRYTQFGALTASMINGGENGGWTNHLPWWYDEETTRIYRYCVNLHRELIPYLFTCLVDAHKQGGTLMPQVSLSEESHRLGPDLFTKAITTPDGKATFSLPAGELWYDYFSQQQYKGGTQVSRTYANAEFPLFVRAGAIIPLNINNSVTALGDSTMTGRRVLLLYPGGKSEKTIHWPTGDGTDYNDVHVSFDNKTGALYIKADKPANYTLLMRGIDVKPERIKGAKNYSYDAATQTLRIQVSGTDISINIQLPVRGLMPIDNINAVTGRWGDQGDGTFRNPILRADYSDPDPLRVGDDYYLVASTFEDYPGVTILHSRDLVNWQTIGAAFTHLNQVSEDYTWKRMRRYNGGVYAPTITYHNGRYFIYANLYTDGFYMAWAEQPEGPWHEQMLRDREGRLLKVPRWSDPCPLWDDDGQAYLMTSHPRRTHWYSYLFQMSADGTQLLDADSAALAANTDFYEWPKGGTVVSPYHSSEGNRIFKKDGYYYLQHIEFTNLGQGEGTYIARSRHIYGTHEDGTPGTPGNPGKYEMRCIERVHSRDSMLLPGQGGYVTTPDGRWWWIGQFTRDEPEGRVPWLVPVRWEDGWPELGDSNGRAPLQMEKPIQVSGSMFQVPCLPQGSDDFGVQGLRFKV